MVYILSPAVIFAMGTPVLFRSFSTVISAEPGVPVGPIDPIGPVGPIGPIGPVGPIGPA